MVCHGSNLHRSNLESEGSRAPIHVWQTWLTWCPVSLVFWCTHPADLVHERSIPMNKYSHDPTLWLIATLKYVWQALVLSSARGRVSSLLRRRRCDLREHQEEEGKHGKEKFSKEEKEDSNCRLSLITARERKSNPIIFFFKLQEKVKRFAWEVDLELLSNRSAWQWPVLLSWKSPLLQSFKGRHVLGSSSQEDAGECCNPQHVEFSYPSGRGDLWEGWYTVRLH